ncbi:Alpha/Beta hydrolase protein [Cladochytrium replicatum]|nr:Alpha/Beta hydrolase protein [Cladochytrium replicatum]
MARSRASRLLAAFMLLLAAGNVSSAPSRLFVEQLASGNDDLISTTTHQKNLVPLSSLDFTPRPDGSVARLAAKAKARVAKNTKKSNKISAEQVGVYTVVKHDAYPRYQIRVKSSKKLCDPTVNQKVGYLDVDGNKHFFFWFFESRSSPAKDPLVLWLNGGPGCSSLTGLFMELGPCRATNGGSGNGTEWNAYSWNDKSNVIFLDQPVNVGFSYSESSETTNTVDAAKDVYAFLQLFLQEFPKYSALPFHVTGESYAGHYIPAIASEIIAGNYDLPEPPNPDYPDDPLPDEPEADNIYINLASIAIGNGLTDPLTQYKFYADFAADTKYGPVLDADTVAGMRNKYGTCSALISACYNYQNAFACVPAAFYCNAAMISPFQNTGLNIYDVRKKCDPSNNLCYSILTDIENFLNRPEVQSEIGVSRDYVGCNQQINLRFMLAGDWMRPYHDLVPGILAEGVKVLIYAGDADYICNYIGNKEWTLELDWDYTDEFNDADDIAWVSKITGKPAGEYRRYEGLAYLRVYEAGHMVPYDQPEHSLEFFNHWIEMTSK